MHGADVGLAVDLRIAGRCVIPLHCTQTLTANTQFMTCFSSALKTSLNPFKQGRGLKLGQSRRFMAGDWTLLTNGHSAKSRIRYNRHVANATVRETNGCPPISSPIPGSRLCFFGTWHNQIPSKIITESSVCRFQHHLDLQRDSNWTTCGYANSQMQPAV